MADAVIERADQKRIEYFRRAGGYELARWAANYTGIFGQNVKTQRLYLRPDGILVHRLGYTWDGCSGPTRDDRTNMRAGLVHDGLYELMRLGMLDQDFRKAADETFYGILKEDGCAPLRAWYYYQAVRIGGASSAAFAPPVIYHAP
jgi:hypothetical protein